MKKWQENRNYRKICDDKGEVVDHIITVDGIDVSVPEDVFSAYARMDRRERYLSEDVPAGGQQLSLEQMAEDGVLPDYVGGMPTNKSSATNKPLPAEACSFWPPFSRWRIVTGSSSARCSTTASPPENTPGVWALPSGPSSSAGIGF